MTLSHERILNEATAQLRQAKCAVSEEISRYPTPISGCDAQFNHLLAERARLTAALDALTAEVFIPTPRTPSEFSGVESR